MKNATNLTPIEMAEETTYNVLTMGSVAGLVGSVLIVGHIAIFHGVFSILFISIAGVSLAGIFLFLYLKKRRFGNRNYSLGERVKKLELALGENV